MTASFDLLMDLLGRIPQDTEWCEAQRGCKVFILGYVHNPNGFSSENLALIDLYLSRGLD